MKCFELVKTVLDEIYPLIPFENDMDKDKEIKKRFDYLEEKYRNLLKKEMPVNYRDHITRFAYIYRYVTCHANIVYQEIENSPTLKKIFDKEIINVTCIGGGPGSDFLGILKYLINNNKSPSLRCTLYDKEPIWNESWRDVDDKVKAEFKISTSVEPFDVTDKGTWSFHKKYLKSELFTLIYFISEIYQDKAEAKPFFENLFINCNPGAIFLFADNNNMKFYKWFDELAESCDMNFILKKSGERTLPTKEEKRALGIYYEKFGDPRLKPNTVVRIFQKRI